MSQQSLDDERTDTEHGIGRLTGQACSFDIGGEQRFREGMKPVVPLIDGLGLGHPIVHRGDQWADSAKPLYQPEQPFGQWSIDDVEIVRGIVGGDGRQNSDQDVVLVAEVPVQRVRGDPCCFRQTADRGAIEAVGHEHFAGGDHDVLALALPVVKSAIPGHTTNHILNGLQDPATFLEYHSRVEARRCRRPEEPR